MDGKVSNLQELLERRQHISDLIVEHPYQAPYYLLRSRIYAELGYPDLAVLDAYKTLLLVDEYLEDSGEYHDQVSAALEISGGSARDLKHDANLQFISEVESDLKHLDGAEQNEDRLIELAAAYGRAARICSIHYLTTIGCLRSAFVFVQQVQPFVESNAQAAAEVERFYSIASAGEATISMETLVDRAYVRREIYPWNTHEEDRNTNEALELLNRQMTTVSSKLEVKVTELPVLTKDNLEGSKTNKQLGVFATEDIAAGEEILRERSLLTANARFQEPVCDACGTELPVMSTNAPEDKEQKAVVCAECDDIVFCSQTCHDLAQHSYHPALCGMDVESIAKEVPPNEAADALYTLLLLRSLAMAQTQDMHPLDLKEIKYIWGDFVDAPPFVPIPGLGALEMGDLHFNKCDRTLPFSFSANVLLPLHMLEKMDINVFESDAQLSEMWVLNTLYAKFRGTASGRVNPRNGRPEVAAVHPIWCLANHNCDPNVQWEWAGEIKFQAREKRMAWTRKEEDGTMTEGKPGKAGGIKKGEEILNHYVDIELPVKERREWGAGALGGNCMCERCVWEAVVVSPA